MVAEVELQCKVLATPRAVIVEVWRVVLVGCIAVLWVAVSVVVAMAPIWMPL